MTLFFSSQKRFIDLAQKKGFAALGDRLLCCDRVPVWPDDLAIGVVNIKVKAGVEVGEYQVFPMDMPEGRWFDVPVQELDRYLNENRSDKNS